MAENKSQSPQQQKPPPAPYSQTPQQDKRGMVFDGFSKKPKK